jgi:hypothetical protein
MDDDSHQSAWEAERRKMSRLTFTVSAEVIDHATRTRFSHRMVDIGTGGCFLDTLLPLPIGSRVRVTLRLGDMDFKAEGQVVYIQPRLGMGIAFDELKSELRLTLLPLLDGR